jgi:hypothetical protein
LVQIGQVVGSVINLENTGNTTVHIINTSVFSPEFWLGRQNLSLGAGATDTLGIFYSPLDVGPDTATVYITADDPVGVHSVIVTGEGSSTTGTDDRLPVAFAAWQNQPNPFSGMTRIRYALPQRAEVSLDVYNVLGQRVASLVHETQEPGVYSVPFGSGAFAISGRARTLTSGVYFYQFKAGPYSATRKMLMLH